MIRQSAFIFLSPNSGSEFDHTLVTTKDFRVAATRNYNDAGLVANELANQSVDGASGDGVFSNQ